MGCRCGKKRKILQLNGDKQATPVLGKLANIYDDLERPERDSQELTDVERAIEIVINNFHCYAVKGRKECLTPNELKDLVGQRLPHLAKGVGPLEEKIECLGDNEEAKLEFGEYWDIMGDAAKGSHVPKGKK